MVMSLTESLTRIKNAVYGREVREAIHDGVFRANQIADGADAKADKTQIRQDAVEDFNTQVIQEMTDKDVISAPEIIASRDGEATLSDRLTRDFGEVFDQVSITDATLKPSYSLWEELNSRGLNIKWLEHLVTNDDWTNAIQTAIDLLTNGGKIIFPAGVYNVKVGNIAMRSNISLEGVSYASSVINFVRETENVPGNNYIFIGTLIENINIQNIHLKATTTYDTGSAYSGCVHGVHLDKVKNVYFENVKVSDFNFNGVLVRNTQVVGYEEYYSRNISFVSCIFEHNRSTGLRVESTIGLRVIDCIGIGSGLRGDNQTGYGMVVGGSLGPHNKLGVMDVIVTGCTFEGNWRKGLDVHNGVDIVISGNTFRDNLLYGIFVANTGDVVVPIGGSVVISDNILVNDGIDEYINETTGTKYAVYVSHGPGADKVSNNPITNIIFSNNIIRDYNVGNDEVLYLNSNRKVTMIGNQIDLPDEYRPTRVLDLQAISIIMDANIIEFSPVSDSTRDMFWVNYTNSWGHIVSITGNTIISRNASTADMFSIYKNISYSVLSNNIIQKLGSGNYFKNGADRLQMGDFKVLGGNVLNNDTSSIKLSSKNSSVVGNYNTVLSSDASKSSGEYSTTISSKATENTAPYSVAGGWASTEVSAAGNRKWELGSNTGNVTYTGMLKTSFADFGEYFKNLDDSEIALGYLVSLSGDGVRKSNEGETPIGVVSGSAAIALGDSPFSWQGRYVTGDFGEPIYENVTNSDGSEMLVPKENLIDYNPDQVQIPRSERPDEWTLVGLLGQVYVRVDDTVSAGNYISSGNDGIGTCSESVTNIRVMRITKEFTEGYGIAYCLIK